MPSPIVSPAPPRPDDGGALLGQRSRSLSVRPPAPELLHPDVWHGHQLGRAVDAACPTGFSRLDAELPGGGWPTRSLTELLLPGPGVGEIRLVAPSLASAQREGRLVMLFDPPGVLSGGALARLGLDVEQLLVIQTTLEATREATLPAPRARLWALEQALKSGHVGAVLAWLPPHLSPDTLRRLQLAAHAHDGPAFMLRSLVAQRQSSAAPLRLALQADGVDGLGVRIVKRRGPPLLRMLRLALPAARDGVQGAEPWQTAPPARPVRAVPVATFVNLA